MPMYDIYVANGLTAVSNLEDIMPRDSAGNVILNMSNDIPSNLIIETITEKYSKRSVVNALPTAFSYFSFPVAENVPPQDLVVDTDFSDILPEIPDLVFARYRPTTNYSLPKPAGNVSVSGIEFSTVDTGLQPRPNQYLITKQIIDLNIPLLFRIKFTVNNLGSNAGAFRVSIIKNDTESGLVRNYIPGVRSGDPNQYFPIGGSPIIPAGGSYTFDINETIQPSEFIRGATFQIGAAQSTNSNLTIDSATSYWVISDATQNVNEFGEPI
jgi:hypothetical protein